MSIPDDLHPKLVIKCDDVSALEKVGIDRGYIKCSGKHVDLPSIISQQWEVSPF